MGFNAYSLNLSNIAYTVHALRLMVHKNPVAYIPAFQHSGARVRFEPMSEKATERPAQYQKRDYLAKIINVFRLRRILRQSLPT
jgi:hypothetical protein